jgi:hypothetical protein
VASMVAMIPLRMVPLGRDLPPLWLTSHDP